METAVDRGRCAFAICAVGDRYLRYRDNLVRGLRKHAPDVDIVDIDITRTSELLCRLPEADRPYFARLAIPVMAEFGKYDRVVWIDADSEVVSGNFSKIFDENTSRDGLAATADIQQKDRIRKLSNRWPGWHGKVYFKSGVVLFDLRKIDPSTWRTRILDGIDTWLDTRNMPGYHDQDVLNGCFEIAEIDRRFCGIVFENDKDAWLVSYAGGEKAKAALDRITASGR